MNLSKPRITLSSRVPVVNQEMEIRIDGLNSPEKEAAFFISFEGKKVLEEESTSLNGKMTKKWTPKETGFYTASFDFGSKSPTGKISLNFPVVWRDLYFLVWPPIPYLPFSKDKVDQYRYLSSYIILHGSPGSGYGDEEIPFWKSKGCKTLRRVLGLQYPEREYPGKNESEIIDACVEKWSSPMKIGYDGIFIDEFGQYPNKEGLKAVEIVDKALMRLRKENPDMLIFPASGGALLREEAISYKYSDSMALLETYGTCFTKYFGSHSIKKHIDNRIEVARNTDLIYEVGRKHGALILLGLNGCDAFHEEPPIPELEDSVRYIKKTAPEMPGIGFYGAGATKQYLIESGLLEAAEEFCLKYYIKPVVDIRDIWFSDYSPVQGKILDVFVNVHNLGGMDAKKVRLRIYARNIEKGTREEIGKVEIKKIGCGFMELKKSSQDKLYDYQEVNENKYAVFDKYNTVFLARTTAKISWKPKKKGYYSITAEVEPSDDYTILDGTISTNISVIAVLDLMVK